MHNRASTEVVSAVLEKTLRGAALRRIPRNPAHRGIVLALLCSGMRRRYPYSEPELNEFLKVALGKLYARVDHVTCRRYLVDLGFVKRDRAGARYILNYPKVESTLSEEVLGSASELIENALAANRRPSRSHE